MQGHGWVAIKDCDRLPVAVVTDAAGEHFDFRPVRVQHRGARPLTRIHRYNFDLTADAEIVVASKVRGQQTLLRLDANQVAERVRNSGRSAYAVLRLVQPDHPVFPDRMKMLAWAAGLNTGRYGVVSIDSPLLDSLTGGSAKVLRQPLPWWDLDSVTRIRMLQLVLYLFGRPGYRGAKIEGVCKSDYDALQWCGIAADRHTRLDAHDTVWLTPDAANPTMNKGVCAESVSTIGVQVYADAEAVLVNWRGEIAAHPVTRRADWTEGFGSSKRR